MSTTALQAIAAAANWQLRVNENFDSVSPSGLYGRNPATTTGLTWGYLGGNFNGVSVANGTVALTASNTNYVVAHRTTGVVTAATTTTNWLNTSVYLQLYQIVAGASTITSYDDKRQAFGIAAITAAAGSTTQIQYNSSGVFAGDAGMTYTLGTQTAGFVNVTLTGLLVTAASAAGAAGLRVPHGAAPTTPTNGDLWTTTAGLYARINGATIGPFATSAGSLTNPMTSVGDVIVGTTAGAPARLAIGTDAGMVLTSDGTTPVWAPPRILQNSLSAAYTLVLSDAGKHIYHPSADTTARIWTIPANSSVAFPIGTAVTFDNDTGAGVITIAITTDTLVLVGSSGSTGSRTLASGGQATAVKVTSTRWRISGVGLT